MKNCISDYNFNCDQCPIYRCYKSLWQNTNQLVDCSVSWEKAINDIHRGFFLAAGTSKYRVIAFNLILSDIHFSRVSIHHLLDLCTDFLQNEIALGLKEGTDYWTQIFNRYQRILQYANCFPNFEEQKRLEYIIKMYEFLFQYYHLTKNYSHVIDLYNNDQNVKSLSHSHDSTLKVATLRIDTQYSASLFLNGKNSSDNNFVISSRRIVENLYQYLFNHSVLGSNEYFLLAKLLEHYIQEGHPGEGLRQLESFVQISINDTEINSIGEAIEKTIFHRDVYQAGILSGSSRHISHLAIAKRIATEYSLQDQIVKIQDIEKKLDWVSFDENSTMTNWEEDVTRIRNKQFSIDKPYVFISYPHRQKRVVCKDVAKLCENYNIWFDMADLHGGRSEKEEDWTAKIKPIIGNSNCKGVIFYFCPETLESIGQLMEAEYIIARKKLKYYTFFCGIKKY